MTDLNDSFLCFEVGIELSSERQFTAQQSEHQNARAPPIVCVCIDATLGQSISHSRRRVQRCRSAEAVAEAVAEAEAEAEAGVTYTSEARHDFPVRFSLDSTSGAT